MRKHERDEGRVSQAGSITGLEAGPMTQDDERTRMFRIRAEEPETLSARQVLFRVYDALLDRGYNPINQIVGYLLSGDPAYITGHMNARSIIRKLERDELLEELVRFYLRAKMSEEDQG